MKSSSCRAIHEVCSKRVAAAKAETFKNYNLVIADSVSNVVLRLLPQASLTLPQCYIFMG